jgi:hypothetical protein
MENPGLVEWLKWKEHLLSKCEALNSNPNAAKKKSPKIIYCMVLCIFIYICICACICTHTKWQNYSNEYLWFPGIREGSMRRQGVTDKQRRIFVASSVSWSQWCLFKFIHMIKWHTLYVNGRFTYFATILYVRCNHWKKPDEGCAILQLFLQFSVIL